jgi:hypothetical protein
VAIMTVAGLRSWCFLLMTGGGVVTHSLRPNSIR